MLTKERDEHIRSKYFCSDNVHWELLSEIDRLRDENLNLGLCLEGEKKDSIQWKHNYEEACASRDKCQVVIARLTIELGKLDAQINEFNKLHDDHYMGESNSG